MSYLTSRRTATVANATVALLVFAVALVCGSGGPSGVVLMGPLGSVVAGVFATSCAVSAAKAARGGQRSAWMVMVIGLAGWTAADLVWCYVTLGGNTMTFSNASVADLGFAVLPLWAVIAALVVPSRDDTRVGIGLVLDGVL